MWIRAVLALSAMAGVLTGQTAFYVSPSGDDQSPGTIERPFRTIEKARDAVRSVQHADRDVVVYLGGGTYAIEETITFDARDSGSGDHDVVYRGYPGEIPIISGGRKIPGWQHHSGNRWKARTDLDNFRQLYVNGRRALRARGGPLPGAQFAGGSSYTTTDATMARWGNQGDIEFVYDVQWERDICKVGKIQAQSTGAIVAMQEPYFTIARLKEGKQVDLPTYIENAIELLDSPGEWYLDRSTATVYYIPRAGETVESAIVVAPVVERLLAAQGTLDNPVHNLRFEGITFADSGWLQPSRIGHVSLQANFTMDQRNLFFRVGSQGTQSGTGKPYLAHPFGEGVKSPAAILLRAAESVHFERCKFTRLGGAGIDIEFGSRANTIAGCELSDIAGSGIQVGDVNDHHPKDARTVVRGNRIVNNYIHQVAVEYTGGVGIFAGYTDNTVIAHNEISHLPYTAISIGWGWGETDSGGGAYWQPRVYDTPTSSRNNVCEHNHIHHVMGERWDGGAIYTLGNMPGTSIRGNLIHDNSGWPGAIYLDEGSGFIEIADNIIYNVGERSDRVREPKATNYNNRRQNRFATCKERNTCFNIKPGEKGYPKDVAGQAGLEPAYRDLLK
jgi:hypothetical protein